MALGERLEEIGGEQVLGAFLGHVAALLSGVCSCACAGEPLYCSCPGSSYNTCHSSTDGRLKASDVCDRTVLAFVRGSDGDTLARGVVKSRGHLLNHLLDPEMHSLMTFLLAAPREAAAARPGPHCR